MDMEKNETKETYVIGGNDQCERECYVLLPRIGFLSAYSSDAPWGNRLMKAGFVPDSCDRGDNRFCRSVDYSSPKQCKGSSLLGLRPNAAWEQAEEGAVLTRSPDDVYDPKDAFSDEPLKDADGKSRPSAEQETAVSWLRCSPWAAIATTDNTAVTKMKRLFAAAGDRVAKEGWSCVRRNGTLICRVPRGCVVIRKIK